MLTRLAIGIVGALLSAAAATSSFAQDQDWTKVLDAAKKEGSLTVYHAQLGAPHWKKVVDSFKAKYGIDVKEFDARASEMTERIRTEQTSGRFIADMEFHGYASIRDQIKTDFVAELGHIPNARNIREDMPPSDKHSVTAWLQFVCTLVNTNLVKPGDEPKKYADFLDPKFKGKMLSDDLRAVGAGQTFFAILSETYGLGMLEKFKAQELTFDRDIQQAARRVARGEYAIFLQQIIAFASPLKGLPVKVIVPEEGCPVSPIQGAILRGAPHPNAARVFINHFLDMESQVTYADAWMGSVVKGVDARLTDPDARRFAQAKVLGYVTPDVRVRSLKAANEMFK